MDELIRTKMHEALDVEQPDGGLRSRILSSLPADERLDHARTGGIIPMGRRTELAAGIAAVVLAAIVIGSFAYIRAVTRQHTVTPPVPSASPGFQAPRQTPELTTALNADPATPVILFNDAGDSYQVDGMTWDGRAGTVAKVSNTGQYPTSAESSNPAGTLFVAFPNILDRSGQVVAQLTGGPYADSGVGMYFVGTWADDEIHYCQVVPIFGGATSVPGTLQLTTPGGKPRDVAHVGTEAAGENTLTPTACSVLADRAVVVQVNPSPGPDGNLVNQYWVVQLSTGHVLWTHSVRGRGIAKVVASRDGRYVAEVQATGTTTIYDSNGSAVGHADGSIEAFSWDGSLALVVANGGEATVVRWSDGTTIWTVPPGEGLAGFQPQPGGTSFAIKTVNSAVYVVSSDGRVLAQRQVQSGLLGCLPKNCASIPASAVTQVLPQMMVGNVGWAGATQRTTDGGFHWRDVSPPTPANPTKGGYAEYVLDIDHAWVTMATGAAGQPSATNLAVFATADGGQTWSQGNVPINGAATESARIDFIDARHGWLITDSGQTAFDKTNTSMVSQPITRAVYSTADGGVSWTLLTTAHEADGSTMGTLGLTCSMNGLTFTSLNDGWLTWDSGCGIGSNAQPPPQPAAGMSLVAVTHDGGRTWQRVNLPSLPLSGDYVCNVHQAVFTLSRGVIPADCGGISVAGVSGVYATNDAGRTWSFRQLPVFSQQIDFADANNGWTFGTPGVSLYRTTDGGSHWTVAKPFDAEQNFSSLSFVDSKVGFAMTSRYSADGSAGYQTMWKTTDGGLTWSVMSSLPTGPRGRGCC